MCTPIILLLEGLAVHPKLFRGPLVDRDRRLAQGWFSVRWGTDGFRVLQRREGWESLGYHTTSRAERTT
jgi:hypothetical protein